MILVQIIRMLSNNSYHIICITYFPTQLLFYYSNRLRLDFTRCTVSNMKIYIGILVPCFE